jgi:hypothetical protein
MSELSIPVGVFVADDNQALFERTVEPGSTVYINDQTRRYRLEIFIGDSPYIQKESRGSTRCFVLTEPPEIFIYDKNFLDRFDFLAGPKFSYLGERENIIISNPIIPFFVGVEMPIQRKQNFVTKRIPQFTSHQRMPVVKFSIPELLELEMRKTKSLSVIVSSKKMTPQQIDRINFVKFLERNSKIPLKIYGGLTAPIRDKYSVLANSTHHIAIENSLHDDYWTEKFADSLLSLNHTFYCGAPNLSDYFSNSIFDTISLNNFKRSQAIIEESFFSCPVDLVGLRNERVKLIHENSLMSLIRKIVTRI